MTVIRAAHPSDAVVLARMNREFNHQSIRPGAIAAKLRRNDEIVLLAEVDAKAAGFACAQVMDSFCYERPYAELTELYTGPEYRRRGCGTSLVNGMEKLLAGRGVVHVHILTAVKNGPARALYEKLGYRSSHTRPEMLYDKNMKPGKPSRRNATRRPKPSTPVPIAPHGKARRTPTKGRGAAAP